MAQGSSCPLSGLAKDKVTMVYPGGGTRCIHGADFAFQVIPGDTDKLLLHLDGGGSCWDKATTLLAGGSLCAVHAFEKDLIGFRNLCPGPNPFGSHTAILVSHCSGDMHSGDVRRPWENPSNGSISIEQRGYRNTRSVIEWIKANMDPKLSHLAFTGESAGSIGVAVWSSIVLREFEYDRAYVLADSFVGVFPHKFQQDIWKDLGACDTVLARDNALRDRCFNGSITIAAVFESAMQEFPNVTFGHINSKHDIMQTVYYGVAAATQRIKAVEDWCGDVDPDECDFADAPGEVQAALNVIPEVIFPARFHRLMEDIIERFSKQPNYVSYLMSSNCHSCGHSTFGTCPIDYEHPPSSLNTGWLVGEGELQRRSVQKWVSRFFGFAVARDKCSHCEALNDEEVLDEDDWCADAQQLKCMV